MYYFTWYFVGVDSQSPGPSGINEVSQSSIATPEMVPIPQEIRDVSLIEADTMTISYNCDTNLSDASSEMLINYDNFQDSQQPIFFSNFILQVSYIQITFVVESYVTKEHFFRIQKMVQICLHRMKMENTSYY